MWRSRSQPFFIAALCLALTGFAGPPGSVHKAAFDPVTRVKAQDGCRPVSTAEDDGYYPHAKLTCGSPEAYLAAARTGDAEAMFALAEDYRRGAIAPGDPSFQFRHQPGDGSQAVRWYRAAAGKGLARAMTGLATLYLDGDLVRRDPAEGLRRLRKAADRGEPLAMHTLGAMMLKGEAAPRDPAAGVRLLRAAEAKGYPTWAKHRSATNLSVVTKRPERLGQCFNTRVREVMERLGPYAPHAASHSGSAIQLADGHYTVAYEQQPGVDSSRRGDPVRLCVVDLPTNCPAGDTRGIGYRGLNLRTRRGWEAGDSEHLCGGA